jgi:DNA-binding transcriptional regulator YhcF (GntR family)
MKYVTRGAARHPLIGTENKVESIVRHCVYMIATGKWRSGDKLPSIRQAEERWGVNRLTVQRAYRRLEEMRLTEGKDRSGYYVATNTTLQRLTRHRYELDRLFEEFDRRIRTDTDFSTLAVLRYMSHLADIRMREEPDCAFVECTAIQASGHAREILERFDYPVIPLTTDEVGGTARRLPPNVRIVLTTLFHADELKEINNQNDLTLLSVPIEVSPALIDEIRQSRERVVLLEAEETMARHIALDAMSILRGLAIDIEVVSDVNRRLESYINRHQKGLSHQTVLLTPRHWGGVPEQWRSLPFIRPVGFSLADDAWPLIADALGLPLGETC